MLMILFYNVWLVFASICTTYLCIHSVYMSIYAKMFVRIHMCISVLMPVYLRPYLYKLYYEAHMMYMSVLLP